MASSQLFIILAVLAIFAPSILAKDFVVGDEQGWTVKIDYEAWAKGKQFNVGDNLLFKYPPGAHNVVEVKENEFKECAAPSSTKPLISGKDVIKLDSPGKRWFICSVGKHCQMGNQKVAINVQSSSSSSSSSSSTPSASPSASSPSSPIESNPSPSPPGPSDPSPVTPSPSKSVATRSTVGTRYGWWMVIIDSLWMLMA
ncbi:hypothetical protein M0R45_024586 [Rubus argutus]|uniref:Phytocyanin domain-containing protein n=1 Tax=Rubus argutus TaxID=59490 RepID=A0AAW1WSX6_RUBAR